MWREKFREQLEERARKEKAKDYKKLKKDEWGFLVSAELAESLYFDRRTSDFKKFPESGGLIDQNPLIMFDQAIFHQLWSEAEDKFKVPKPEDKTGATYGKSEKPKPPAESVPGIDTKDL